MSMGFARVAAAAAVMAALLTACNAGMIPLRTSPPAPTLPPRPQPTVAPEPLPTFPPEPEPTFAPQPEPTLAPEPEPASLAPLARDIIGIWSISHSADAAAAFKISTTWGFYPDAHYEYVQTQCAGLGNCAQVEGEWGWAQTSGDIVQLSPMSASTLGPRGYRYGFTQNELGNTVLILVGADGLQEIFEFQP
jgi:hypothetical protein